MRQSNEELWEAAGLGVYQDMSLCDSAGVERFADAVRADEAEHAKEEQRQMCAAAEHKAWMMDSNRHDTEAAILNAGVAPVLKVGMLATDRAGRGYAFEWSTLHTEFDAYRPMTRAEIQPYMDKAPE